MTEGRVPVLLSYPFRPFFLLTGAYGALVVLAWLAFFFGWLGFPATIFPHYWHAHEMLFGLVPAAIAGFLLTAMSNWTGTAPLSGRGLLGLLLLWTAGRIAMWLAGPVPLLPVALVDLAFLPSLAAYSFTVLRRHGNRRNFLLPVLLGVLSAANLAMHLSFLGLAPALAPIGMIVALDVITVVMVVIAGRIVPAFTANWLAQRGARPAAVRRSARLDTVALGATVAMVPADLATPWPWLGGAVALAAALANGLRLAGWSGWRTGREPLLWILHIGYAWIVAALVLKGLTPWLSIPASAWYHAMGSGAMATLILGVMTRVALGHTGRTLRLPAGAPYIYFAILVAAVLRVAAALPVMAIYTWLIAAAAFSWAAAFVLFTAIYWPILSRPRIDGRPG